MTTNMIECSDTDHFKAAIKQMIHQVEWKNADGSHLLTFTCLGDEASKCHQYPDCGCDFWDEDHVHPKVPHTDCWLVSWFENDGQGVSYDGDDCISDCDGIYADYCPPADRIGFIDVVLEDEWVNWRWIENPTVVAKDINL
jgi:hypothetical protein